MDRREVKMDIERRILRTALAVIAATEDCGYLDVNRDERPDPCVCPPCTARRALAQVDGDWRFIGRGHERMEHNPRERRLVDQWRTMVEQSGGRFLLEQILGMDGEIASERDWYVATTIIQWLGTNVGMTILTGSGFQYHLWDKDREEHDKRERREKVGT